MVHADRRPFGTLAVRTWTLFLANTKQACIDYFHGAQMGRMMAGQGIDSVNLEHLARTSAMFQGWQPGLIVVKDNRHRPHDE